MRIVVIGGTGRIGSKLVDSLTARGHEAVPAAPSTGVDAVTGEGLAEALAGADVVVDVTNSPSFDEEPATEFFSRSTTNLLNAEAQAGVGHHVALSVVGTEEMAPQSGYFRAKLAQEKMIASGPVPYTIVHATQFFEFLTSIADTATVDGTVRLPEALIQPIASADVAEGAARAAVAAPVNGIVEIGGPQAFSLPDLIGTTLRALGDDREVVTDPAAGYWGVDIDEQTLIPGDGATLFPTAFDDWLRETTTNA
jgi:uncharacterized protein YbjT (DUF2867 family)